MEPKCGQRKLRKELSEKKLPVLAKLGVEEICSAQRFAVPCIEAVHYTTIAVADDHDSVRTHACMYALFPRHSGAMNAIAFKIGALQPNRQ